MSFSRSRLRHARHPRLEDRVVARPQVVVPPRRPHAGAVAAGGGEPVVRPRHPRRGRLDLRQALEALVVVLLRHRIRVEHRRVPRAADDRDALEALLLRLADGLAHPRLAERLVVVLARRGAVVPPLRSSAIASRIARNTSAPSCRRCSTTCSHHRSPSSNPAARASCWSGSGSGMVMTSGDAARSPARVAVGAVRRPPDSPPAAACVFAAASISSRNFSNRAASNGIRCHCGRSMNRTGTFAPTAHRIACHSGENSANG